MKIQLNEKSLKLLQESEEDVNDIIASFFDAWEHLDVQNVLDKFQKQADNTSVELN